MSDPTATSLYAIGETRAIRKKACAPAHIETAGAAMFSAIRRQAWPSRHDMIKLSAAMAIAAGAGPNNTASVMKNVSEIEMVATTDAILTLNDPMAIASAANSSHSYGRGVPATATTECTMTAAPIATTARTTGSSAPDGAR